MQKMESNSSQMDYVLPNELVDGMIAAGGKKSTVSIKNLMVRGFYSGAILGLANTWFSNLFGNYSWDSIWHAFLRFSDFSFWICQYCAIWDGVGNW